MFESLGLEIYYIQLNVDSQTMNTIILMLGTMYGVGGAANAVKVLANMLGNGVQKQLMKKALTKEFFIQW